MEIVTSRRTYRLRGISPDLMQDQQRIADLFHQEKILPKKIDVKEAWVTPEQYAALTPATIISQN